MEVALPRPLARRRALADDVHQALTALIMDHAIEPNARMNIEALARSLDVSPTPVREALARLESDGLVIKEALRGYRTTALLTPLELDHLFEFRRLVEPWGAGRAAECVGPADVAMLEEELASAHELPRGTDYAAYRALAEHDRRFHALVLRIAGNPMVLEAFERRRVHLHLFRLSFSLSMAGSPAREHATIVTAITSGEPGAASAAMLDHLAASHARISGAISETVPAP